MLLVHKANCTSTTEVLYINDLNQTCMGRGSLVDTLK